MNLLLDTPAILWWALDDKRLPDTVRSAVAAEDCRAYYSIASVWEIAIKFGIGKLPEADRFVLELRHGRALPGFLELPISVEHAVKAGILQSGHRDPFDRMLIAQAEVEGLTLVSNERLFDRFGVPRLWD